jgi:hypothetical protein
MLFVRPAHGILATGRNGVGVIPRNGCTFVAGLRRGLLGSRLASLWRHRSAPVDRKESEALNRLVRSLVRGYPFVASVQYDKRASSVIITCRATRGPTKERSQLKREWSPTVLDSVDLDRYVRDRVGEFLRLWINDEPAHSDAGNHQDESLEGRSLVSGLLPVACQKPNDDAGGSLPPS